MAGSAAEASVIKARVCPAVWAVGSLCLKSLEGDESALDPSAGASESSGDDKNAAEVTLGAAIDMRLGDGGGGAISNISGR